MNKAPAVAMVVLAAVGLEAKSPAARQGSGGAALTVIVLNQAGVSGKALEAALEHAGEILSRAGVPVSFTVCARNAEESRPAVCSEPLRSDRVLLQLMPGMPVRRVHAVGTTFVRREDGLASIVLYPEMAEILASASGWTNSELLAHLIGHEIGHVLLSAGHTSGGIMRAVWSPASLISVRHAQAMFDGRQSEQMREALGTRRLLAQAQVEQR